MHRRAVDFNEVNSFQIQRRQEPHKHLVASVEEGQVECREESVTGLHLVGVPCFCLPQLPAGGSAPNPDRKLSCHRTQPCLGLREDGSQTLRDFDAIRRSLIDFISG